MSTAALPAPTSKRKKAAKVGAAIVAFAFLVVLALTSLERLHVTSAAIRPALHTAKSTGSAAEEPDNVAEDGEPGLLSRLSKVFGGEEEEEEQRKEYTPVKLPPGLAASLTAADGTPLLKAFATMDEWHAESLRTGSHLPIPYVVSSANGTGGEGVARTPPLFLIIGVQKGGTTGLRYNLLTHPLLHGFGGEPHFFDFGRSLLGDKGAEEEESPRQAALESYWESLVRGPAKRVQTNAQAVARGDGFVLDATPSYMFRRNVAPAVYWLMPNVPLVTLLRDPVERYFSAISMEVCRRTILRKEEFAIIFHTIGNFREACARANAFQDKISSSSCVDSLKKWGAALRPGSWAARVRGGQTPAFKDSVPLVCTKRARKLPEHVLRSMYASQLEWWLALFGEGGLVSYSGRSDGFTGDNGGFSGGNGGFTGENGGFADGNDSFAGGNGSFGGDLSVVGSGGGARPRMMVVESGALFKNESAVVEAVWRFAGLPSASFVYDAGHQRPNSCSSRRRQAYLDLVREMEEAGDMAAMQRCFAPHNRRLFELVGEDYGWNERAETEDREARRRRLEALADEL